MSDETVFNGSPITIRRPPILVWIAAIVLGLITLLTMLAAFQSRSGTLFVAAACNAAILVGLLLGYRWAYVLLILFSLLGAGVAFGRSPQQGMMVLLANAVVVVPVLLSTNYYFDRSFLKGHKTTSTS